MTSFVFPALFVSFHVGDLTGQKLADIIIHIKQKRIFSPAPLAKGYFCVIVVRGITYLFSRQKTANFQKDTLVRIRGGRFLTLGLFLMFLEV
jgi:hypothetical protein